MRHTRLFLSFLLITGVANGQPMEVTPTLRITAFADVPTQGDISSDARFAGRIDAILQVDNIWQNGSMQAQLEYVDGDNIVGLGKAGVVWPTNAYTTVPRVMNNNAPEVSVWFTHKFNDRHSVGFGRWSVVAQAEQGTISGGKGKGRFQYLGLSNPLSFLFSPYYLGGSYAYKGDTMDYSVFVYDANNAIGDGYWDKTFKDGLNFNGTATYKAHFGDLPGFYSVNYLYTTKDSTDFRSIDFSSEDFAVGWNDILQKTDEGSFGIVKFQQYLSYDASSGKGWGIFAQAGFGWGSNQLDAHYIFGVAGDSPLEGRDEDRWGVGWARYNWVDELIRLIEEDGGEFQDEWGAEIFYEAKITDVFRIGGNVMYIEPSQPSAENLVQYGLRFRATF